MRVGILELSIDTSVLYFDIARCNKAFNLPSTRTDVSVTRRRSIRPFGERKRDNRQNAPPLLGISVRRNETLRRFE